VKKFAFGLGVALLVLAGVLVGRTLRSGTSCQRQRAPW